MRNMQNSQSDRKGLLLNAKQVNKMLEFIGADIVLIETYLADKYPMWLIVSRGFRQLRQEARFHTQIDLQWR